MLQQFSFHSTLLEGAYLIKPFIMKDQRGAFIKDYSQKLFIENNIKIELKEVFYTHSCRGVIRALHFQQVKEQAKIVRCINGHIYDVIVDLRKNSPTYKQWQGFDLCSENNYQLYIPEHFAHGYLVLEDSVVSYKCSENFYSEYDSGIIWNDSDINIDWPIHKIGGIENIILSDKDKNLQSFKEFDKCEKY